MLAREPVVSFRSPGAFFLSTRRGGWRCARARVDPVYIMYVNIFLNRILDF